MTFARLCLQTWGLSKMPAGKMEIDTYILFFLILKQDFESALNTFSPHSRFRHLCRPCHNREKARGLGKYICQKCHAIIEEQPLIFKNDPYHPDHFNCNNCGSASPHFKPLVPLGHHTNMHAWL